MEHLGEHLAVLRIEIAKNPFGNLEIASYLK